MKIDIILATYNGARFIRTQICSVLSQTYPHWRLLIHDDGSTDDTVRIVKEMAASDTRIQLIEDGVKGLGPGGNFMHLLRCSEAPYVCLCDQDDLWLENKLSVMLEAIEQKDNTQPQVIVTNAYLWTSGQDNRIKGKSNSYAYTKLKDVLFSNGGMQGATMILNATMRKYINKPYRHIAMHDQVITLAGIVTQGIDFLNATLFLYRQHEQNYTAHIPISFKERVIKTIRNTGLPVVERNYYEGTKSFYEMHRDTISQKECRCFELYLSYPSMGKIKRFFSIWTNGFTLRNSSPILLLKLVLRRYI